MRQYKTYTDDRLVELLQQGDENAFAEIYDRYWENMLAGGIRRLGDKAAAEDIIHDVFVNLWQNREHVQIRELKNYLAVAVKYGVLNMLRKVALQSTYEQHLVRHLFTTTDQNSILDDKDRAMLLQQHIDNLPAKCKLIFHYRQLGFSNKEVAEKMNVSVTTVKAHIRTGARQLRTALKNLLGSLFNFI